MAHGGGFGCLQVRCLHVSEKLPATADEHNAPTAGRLSFNAGTRTPHAEPIEWKVYEESSRIGGEADIGGLLLGSYEAPRLACGGDDGHLQHARPHAQGPR